MTWEERMAAKAAVRREALRKRMSEESDVRWEALQEQWIQAYADTLTPEQALAERKSWEENPIGCACYGGPRCCVIRTKAHERVLNQ